jgi:hypothetical protein
MIEEIVAEELESALDAAMSHRVDAARTGYRHPLRGQAPRASVNETTSLNRPR